MKTANGACNAQCNNKQHISWYHCNDGSFGKGMVSICFLSVILGKQWHYILMIIQDYEGCTYKISFWALHNLWLKRRLLKVTKRNQNWYVLYILDSEDTYIMWYQMWLVDGYRCYCLTLLFFVLTMFTSFTSNGFNDISRFIKIKSPSQTKNTCTKYANGWFTILKFLGICHTHGGIFNGFKRTA